MIRVATTGFHASTLYKYILLSLSYVIECRQQGRCILQEKALRSLQTREATLNMWLFLSCHSYSLVFTNQRLFFLFGIWIFSTIQKPKLVSSQLISNFKHSYRNVKYFGIVLAFQNSSWARTLWVTKKEAHSIFSASFLQSHYFGTHSGTGVEVYSTHINTLFEPDHTDHSLFSSAQNCRHSDFLFCFEPMHWCIRHWSILQKQNFPKS